MDTPDSLVRSARPGDIERLLGLWGCLFDDNLPCRDRGPSTHAAGSQRTAPHPPHDDPVRRCRASSHATISGMSEVPTVPDFPRSRSIDSALEAGAAAGAGALGAVAGPAAAAAAGAAVPLLAAWLKSPLEQAREEWAEQVVSALRWLVDTTGKSPTEIASPEFLDALARASQIAASDSTESKRMALLNALCNVAGPSAPSRHKQTVMLRLLDELTELHVRAIGFLINREVVDLQFEQPQDTDVATLLVANVAGLMGDLELAEQVRQELVSVGLLVEMAETSPGLYGMGSPWVPGVVVTPKAHEFVQFISGPFHIDPTDS